jgi:hypothetical protein
MELNATESSEIRNPASTKFFEEVRFMLLLFAIGLRGFQATGYTPRWQL